jgi:hypothetical protein
MTKERAMVKTFGKDFGRLPSGFKNVSLHGGTLSGLNADVTLASTAFSWTAFGPAGTYDPAKGI